MVEPIKNIHQMLLYCKQAIDDNYYEFIYRDNYYATLAKLSFTEQQALNEILSLIVKDYIKGPEQDDQLQANSGKTIWVFGKVINGYEIYIKLKLLPYKNSWYLKVLSFHINDFKFNKNTFPHK